MADEAEPLAHLRNDFYRDGFLKATIALAILAVAIILLLSTTIYLVVTKPAPIVFQTGQGWRVLAPVPLDQPYLKTPDLLQWVSETASEIFTYDFLHYTDQLNSYTHYFTPNGWKKFLELLNLRINSASIQGARQFVSASATGAPYILKQGLLQGKYGWWVQIPLKINYSSATGTGSSGLTIQFLVVRTETLDDINGVIIDNVVWSGESQSGAGANG